MIFKRSLMAFVAMVLIFAFCACGNSEAEKAEELYRKSVREMEESQENIERLEKEIGELEELQRKLQIYGN